MVFDKTGTLTEGKPSVTDVICVKGSSNDGKLLAAINLLQLMKELYEHRGSKRIEGEADFARREC